jgi:hypothetical protein
MPLHSRKPDGGRYAILEYLHQEIIGPRNIGTPISTDLPIKFKTIEESNGPWIDAATGQEILSGIRPKQRYGAGILTPENSTPESDSDSAADEENEDALNEIEPEVQDGLQEDQTVKPFVEEDDDDSENQDPKTIRLPSSMGFSCFVEASDNSKLTFEIEGGWYEPLAVEVENRKFKNETWYVRRVYKKVASLEWPELSQISSPRPLTLKTIEEAECHLDIELIAYVRPWNGGKYLITFTAVNRTHNSGQSAFLFQTSLKLSCNNSAILPYPTNEVSLQDVENELFRGRSIIDDLSMELLFNNYPTYGIGHNCSVDWESGVKPLSVITADCFPIFEGPSITPEIRFLDGTFPNLRMYRFLDSGNRDSIFSELKKISDEYEKWIENQTKLFKESENLERFSEAFKANEEECKSALRRIRRGISLLEENEIAYQAFCLMNRAILIQQIRSKLKSRSSFINSRGRIEVSGEYPEVELLPELENSWRPFQIAFILSVLESVIDEKSVDRELVDLIFFPTGGGKTEAYLGVIAFTILYRRLINAADDGTVVLMRYTLRLLTTQQFLRAASLICALESIRRKDVEHLGQNTISIGAWLGGGVTPNTRQEAIKALEKLNTRPKKKYTKASNPFLVLQCPWCAAEFGQVGYQDASSNPAKAASGYQVGWPGGKRSVIFACPETKCDFNQGLPLYVIDEDLYDARPSLVIGTVDKFAMLSWRPSAQRLFGRMGNGQISDSLPPSLIIQDEFHLISGPLGSMVGHYETVIEDLCTIVKDEIQIKPKIISSTATIRRFWSQANAVYGRDRVSLFPPPLFDISDSFFAVWDRDNEDGELKPGRIYAGVFAPGLGSIRSSQVRVGAALTLAPMLLAPEERDPWWTNLWFFNSLKELFNTISLFQGDIPRYSNRLIRRDKIPDRYIRKLPMELTSRRENSEIPEVLKKLEVSYSNEKKNEAIDVCLASNIIEVGVDIDRMSLMTIVSQPKSTAQYIQVSGRVGRKPDKRPGLVVVIYALGRPRDLSHFEHFRSYHERLYAQVEPTSVTPFATPVIKRGLRGAITAFLRMNSAEDSNPTNIDNRLLNRAFNLFKSRASSILGVSAEEKEVLYQELDLIQRELDRWQPTEWEGESDGFLVRQGLDQDVPDLKWKIPMSMRSVDAGTGFNITTKYHD